MRPDSHRGGDALKKPQAGAMMRSHEFAFPSHREGPRKMGLVHGLPAGETDSAVRRPGVCPLLAWDGLTPTAQGQIDPMNSGRCRRVPFRPVDGAASARHGGGPMVDGSSTRRGASPASPPASRAGVSRLRRRSSAIPGAGRVRPSLSGKQKASHTQILAPARPS